MRRKEGSKGDEEGGKERRKERSQGNQRTWDVDPHDLGFGSGLAIPLSVWSKQSCDITEPRGPLLFCKWNGISNICLIELSWVEMSWYMIRTLMSDKDDEGVVMCLSDSSFGKDFLRHVPAWTGFCRSWILEFGALGWAFPLFWTYVQQLFIEIKCVDPTYLGAGNGEVRITAGYQCVCFLNCFFRTMCL